MESKSLKHPFFVIMGPSGSGKTKVAQTVFSKSAKVISHTTRPRRFDEQPGVDYYFDSKEQFTHLIQTKALVEYDCYNGYYYGVTKEELVTKTKSRFAFDVLTYQGYEAINAQFGATVIPVFLDVSKENVLKRLKARGESTKNIKERLALYEADLQTKQKLNVAKQAILLDANQPFEVVVASLKMAVKQRVGLKGKE